jgi:long-chain acyl-CoA synthetase
MVLTEVLEENAKKFKNVPALTMKMGFRIVTLTYGEIYDLSRCVAVLLEKNGVGKGDSVILLAPNSPYWIVAFWGCLLRGAVAVPLGVQSRPEFVEKVARQTNAKLFFAHRFYKDEILQNLKRYDVDLLKDELKGCDPNEFKKVDLDENDLVEILYTSGTTGDPKGVMLSHKNLHSNIVAVRKIVSLEPCKERLLSILPLSHIFEQAGGFLLPYYYSAHVIYAHSHSAIGDLLKKYKITKMMAVPEFLKILMSKIEAKIGDRPKSWITSYFVRRRLGGKLDTVVCGGAPLDSELEKKWNDLKILILQGYGLTETSPLVSSNTYESHRPGSVGKVVPGVEVRVTDDGEILVKGDNVFRGYFKDEEKTKESFTKDGFFKTGDIGEFDKDGFLFLKGRKKYVILGPGGQNVFPEDIEEILNSFSGVRDSAVLGVEKKSGMVEIHAVLLLDENFSDAQNAVDYANEKLASYQQITDWSVWPEDDFPRSATKKVKKENVLKFLLEQQTQKIPVVSTKTTPLISLLSRITDVNKEKIGEKTTLGSMHVDSLMRVEIIAQIEDSFGVLLDETKITAKLSVKELEEMIEKNEPVKTLPPLRKWPRSLVAKILRFVGQRFVFLIMKLFSKVEVHGFENVKNLKTPIIFMPNHISYCDSAFLVACLPRKIAEKTSFAAANDVLYKDYKWFVPFAELLFNAFPFPRKEGENIRLGLDYMGQMLDAGYSVTVFPEGKVSEDASLLPLKRGAGLVAVEMGVPVVPVLIEESHKIFPYDTIFPRSRGVVKVTFGKPLRFKCTDSYIDATESIEAALKGLKGISE